MDVTNYVLRALGQPLHAFDLHTIRGGRIIVRRAYPGEKITTLDNEDRVLTDDMLVIADAERASVIAGIMGGLDSEVTDQTTTDILLEGAAFSGPCIMRTSGALGLRSEASTRYEKGLDPEMIMQALDMACKLFVEVCGGEVSAGTVDVRTAPLPQTVLSLRSSQVERVLGLAVPADETAGILARLGCEVGGGAKELTVTVPGFRRDLEREIDLIEEIARVHGLEQIPSTLPSRRVGRGGLDRRQALQRIIEDLLVGAGLAQAITYSFGDESWADRLRLPADDERRQAVTISNPLSVEQSRMRRMLLPGLLETVRANQAVREYDARLFEVGRVFHPSGSLLPEEQTKVGLVLSGEAKQDSWLGSERPIDYYLAKGLVERLEAALNCRLQYTPASEPFLHPGKSAVLRTGDGRCLGWVGEVHPLVAQEYDLPQLRGSGRGVGSRCARCRVASCLYIQGSPGLSGGEQDLALVVDAAVPASDLVEQLRAAGGDLLEDVVIFDVYEGAQVGEGKKSLALRLSFRASDRTLNDAEVNELREAILDKVSSALGAQLRA